MKRFTLNILAAFLLATQVCASIALADVDQLYLENSALMNQGIRWYNVEGSPSWVSGVEPFYNRKMKMHMVELSPGTDTLVHLPSYEQLRLVSEKGARVLKALDVSISEGSGLFLSVTGTLDEKHKSLLIKPRNFAPLIARIALSTEARQKLRVAIFTSRGVPFEPLLSYRTLRPLSGHPKRQLSLSYPSGAQAVWHVAGNEEAKLHAKGPGRIQIETRFFYPETEARSYQSYSIAYSIDGLEKAPLSCVKGVEFRRTTEVDGEYRSVGRPCHSFIQVPAGSHQLRLRPTAPLLVRVAELEQENLLFPEGFGFTRAANISETELDEKSSGDRYAEFERSAWQYGKDNTHRESALRGWELLNSAAHQYPFYSVARNLAETVRSNHTFYRGVLPWETQSHAAAQFRNFADPRLRDIGESRGQITIYQQHLAESSRAVPSGVFYEMTADEDKPVVYSLPPRFSTSIVRFAIDAERARSREDLYLQFDDAAPQRFYYLPDYAQPAEKFMPQLSDAALVASRSIRDELRQQRAESKMRIASIELPLSADVTRLKVWSRNGTAVPLSIHYRASRVYESPETTFSLQLPELKPGAEALRWFGSLVKTIATNPQRATPASDMFSHYTPLARYVLAAVDSYELAAECPKDIDESLLSSDEACLARFSKTKHADAISKLTRINEHVNDSDPCRTRAVAKRHALLLELGEYFLAESLLKESAFQSCSNAVALQSARALEQWYRAENDIPALTRLLAALFAKQQDVSSARSLAEALLLEGNTRYALDIILLLDEKQRPTELLLEAALGERWWGVFEKALRQLGDSRRRDYWHARQLEAEGISSNDGALVRKSRSSQDDSQENTSFYINRENVSKFVTKFAGSALIYSPRRDTYQSFYRATKERPLVLRIAGTKELEIEARPVHESSAVRALDAVFEVRREGFLEYVPMVSNEPSPNLEIIGKSNRVGTAVRRTVEVGPGLQTISLAPLEGEMLFHVSVVEQVSIAVAAHGGESDESCNTRADLSEAVSPVESKLYLVEDGKRSRVSVNLLSQANSCKQKQDSSNGVERLRYELRNGQTIRASEKDVVALLQTQEISELEKVLLIARLQMHRETGLEAMLASEAISEKVKQGLRLAYKDSLPQTSAGAVSSTQDALARLEYLVSEVVMRPEASLNSLAVGSAIPKTFLTRKTTQLLNWLERQSAWQRIESVDESAGVRMLYVDGGSAESSNARVREALLPKLAAGEVRVSRNQDLVLALKNLAANEIRLELRRDNIVLGDGRAVRVHLSLNDTDAAVLNIGSRASIAKTLSVPSGNHFLRIWIEDASPFDFLRVRVLGSSAAAENVTQGERRYYIASVEQPLQVTIEGPTVLRVDKRVDNATTTIEHSIAPGIQKMTFTPDNGNDEALYRLFVRAPKTENNTATQIFEIDASPISIPPIAKKFNMPLPVEFGLKDDYQLGAQEDGTLSLRTGIVRRSIFEEGAAGDAEEFLELGASHHIFDEDLNSFFTSEIFVRGHSGHEPSIGLKETIDWYPDKQDLAVVLSGFAIAQSAEEDSAPSSDSIEWRLGANLGVRQSRRLSLKATHVPSISLFGNVLSQDTSTRFLPGSLDQDIYTKFKSDHLYGLRLSESLLYNPWQDSQLSASATLRTNTDMNIIDPDSLSLRIGWEQLVGNVSGGIFYRLAHFLPDKDREREQTRHAVELEYDVQSWQSEPMRLGLWGQVRLDIERDDLAAMLFLSFDYSEGRMLRDLRPPAYQFDKLRNYQAQRAHRKNVAVSKELDK